MASATGGSRLENKEMESQIHLSFDEIIALERILALQTKRAKHNITLPFLMDKWSRFVIKVEKGYQLTIDDYTNSMSDRDLIQDVLNVCSENVDLKMWIKKWDNRFIAETEVTKDPLLHPLDDENLGWWWFRIPVNPGKRLKEWLEIDKSV